MSISASARRDIRGRAQNCCEYCALPQSCFPLVTFHVEHVIAKQHGGNDEFENLCLACHWCNLFKGPNIASMVDGQLTKLFNPRLDNWSDHFRLIDGRIIGLTATGSVTQKLLNMNDPDRIELRRHS